MRKYAGVIAAVYLLGLFIGALDTGIITPARTVIQTSMGVNDAFGIWMITIYTLAYAVSIPIMGKLADLHGRKGVYLVSVALFGMGSLLCGLSDLTDNFYFLLFARALQAFGGGGIMPVATAQFGTAFPEEKRGMALGLVGGVYGIANIFGASAGSLILDIFGQQNWAVIFYINVPICLFIIIAGFLVLPRTKRTDVAPIDAWGILVLSCMIMSLLIGLKNIDFFDLGSSLIDRGVYPYLLVSLALLPAFIFVEKRAQDPVMNLAYFKDRDIVLTLIIAVLTGIILMGLIFIPQFAENALRLPSGDGGYLIIVLGLFSGIGAPVSGKLIDRYGVKSVLGIGFIASLAGSLHLALVTAADPSLFNMVISLILIGLGLGFVIGTPLNYMMLEHTDPEESNSALATLSLVRSIGTAVTPALMVGFLVHAAAAMPERIMETLPDEVHVSALPYAQELTDHIDELKSDEATASMMDGIELPDLTEMQVIKIDMDLSGDSDSGYHLSDEMLNELKSADVTTIVETTKRVSSEMFAHMKPDLMAEVDDGISQGIEGVTSASSDMDASIEELKDAIDEMDSAIAAMDDAVAKQRQAREQMASLLPLLQKAQNYRSVLDLMPQSARDALPAAVREMLANVKTTEDLDAEAATLQGMLEETRETRAQMQAALARVEADEQSAQDALTAELEHDPQDPEEIDRLQKQIAQLQSQKAGLEESSARLESAEAGMTAALTQLNEFRPLLDQMEHCRSVVDLIPEDVKASIPESALESLSDVRSVDDLENKLQELDGAIDSVQQARGELQAARDEMTNAIAQMQSAEADMQTMEGQLRAMQEAVPGSFDEAERAYLAAIDQNAEQIEETFQSTLNEGFKGMFLLVAACSLAGLILLLFYHGATPRRTPRSTVE